MNTAPLHNPASILPNPPPSARQNGTAAPQTPFNQVLSKEVAERHAAGKPNGSADRKAAEAKPQAEAGSAPVAAGEPKAKLEAETESSQPTASASAELLALVAGLQRIADGGTDAASDSATAEAPAAADAPEALRGPRGKRVAPGADPGIPAAHDASLAATKKDAAPASSDGAFELPAGMAAPAADGADAQDAALRHETAFAVALNQATAKPQAQTQPLPSPEALPAAGMAPVAPVVLHAAQAPAAQAADKLTPQVGTPAWDAALGQKVVWMVGGGQQSASLTLNPPDLGPLQVVLHVNNSHANATFVSAQPEVRQALEAAMPRLREMMNDAGIQLGQASVGTGMPDQQQAPADRRARHAGPGAVQPLDTSESAALPARVQALSRGNGLVDTFA